MELFQVELTGFKKFKDKTTLKTRGKIIAILGPNEAGKSSLLRALNLLDVNEAYAAHERSKEIEGNYPIVKATYLLSPEDREAGGVGVGTWFDVTKSPDGNRSWAIRPSPPDRDYSHRPKLISLANKLSKSVVANIEGRDGSLHTDTTALLEGIYRSEKELSEEGKQKLSDLASRWLAASGADAPARVAEFNSALDAAITIETAKSKLLVAAEALWERLPEFVLFGAEDRGKLR